MQYDFGLRSIVRLLRMLSSLKTSSPVESEQVLVVRALRDLNLPQLVDRDQPLFLSLVNDFFPGVVLDRTSHPTLEETLATQVDAAGLVNHSPWTSKLIQVNITSNSIQTSQSRHNTNSIATITN